VNAAARERRWAEVVLSRPDFGWSPETWYWALGVLLAERAPA